MPGGPGFGGAIRACGSTTPAPPVVLVADAPSRPPAGAGSVVNRCGGGWSAVADARTAPGHGPVSGAPRRSRPAVLPVRARRPIQATDNDPGPARPAADRATVARPPAGRLQPYSRRRGRSTSGKTCRRRARVSAFAEVTLTRVFEAAPHPSDQRVDAARSAASTSLALVNRQLDHARHELERLVHQLADAAPADDANASRRTSHRRRSPRMRPSCCRCPALAPRCSRRCLPREATRWGGGTTTRFAVSAG